MNFIKKVKRLTLIKLDALACIFWFLMDFLWMWGLEHVSFFIIPIVLTLLVLMIYRSKSASSIKSTFIILCWFIMNSCWVLSDIFILNSNILKIIGTVFGIYVLYSLYIISIRNPKTINKFKRGNLNH